MSIDFLSLFFCMLFFGGLLFLKSRFHFQKPALLLSRSFVPLRKKGLKEKLHSLEMPLRWGALFCFGIALSNPERVFHKEQIKVEAATKGIAIYFLVDRSGSMQEKITPEVAKIDWVRHATAGFIKKRTNDLMGLIAFARKADLLSPLTLDHATLQNKLDEMKVAKTEAEDGTVIGYSIFKTVNLIVGTRHFAAELKGREKSAYSIKNQIIVVLTDGLQSPNPLDRNNPFRFMGLKNAAQFAQENEVRIYFIGVVPDQEREAFMDQMHTFKEAVENTGGHFYLTPNEESLAAIYDSIDAIEKSDVVSKSVHVGKKAVSLAPYFAACGLFLLVASILIETCFARLIP